MIRADLRWALDATLPHVGKTPQTAVLLLSRPAGDSRLCVAASDNYTAGVARVADGPAVDCALPATEARDLLKFVRPTRVAHDSEDVVMMQQDGELHVGFVNSDGETYDSAVFDTTDSHLTVAYLDSFFERLRVAPVEEHGSTYWPRLFGRFSKAERDETDRLCLYPRRTSDRHGAALVTVGDHFTGAVAGMEYEQAEESAA